MQLKELKPRKSLNKAFLKVKPNRIEIEGFKANLIQLLDRSNDTESEEFHKNLVIDFLKKTYYDPNHFINTKGRNDLVIHNGNTAKSSVGVIIEAKKPTNKSEMMTTEKLNVKAFQELVLYYLRERITNKNLEVKHLIATNINEWFIFDVAIFERLFAQNKEFVKHFNDFESGRLADTKTDFFYKQIAEPFIAAITNEIEFTYFNFQDYQKPLRNANKADLPDRQAGDNSLIALFKILSPEHLLKLPFTNDSNSLDKRFYTELLHIVGLSETKEGSKKLIGRNKAGERHTGTILEDTIIQLDSLDKINRLDNPSQYGKTTEDKLFNVALELSITWINRILFLKLLEAQLIAYHKGNKAYAFLNYEKIKNYDDLNRLFFQVLAQKYDDRIEDVKKAFEKVPYLNSSLFELTELEQVTFCINSLIDDKTIPIISSTVLKNDQGKKRTGTLNTLEYLFQFLDAYDFSSEGSEDIQEDNKTLINASVLGLIFEKINGYKDGSFFTPGFITMYMCRETIRKAVVQKFNETKKWNCNNLEEIYDKIEDRKEANQIVNSIKICDPAVGSGHFLVSALNEMIAVKNDLGILCDFEGRVLKHYWVEVVNDELFITEKESGKEFYYLAPNPRTEKSIKHTFGGDSFSYKASQLTESQIIQQSIFLEKQTIIENCLFGVDINPNSVKICRLRLWIELLKSSYYTPESNFIALETLPNIDINIKCGNSLVSRFAIDADLSKALKKSKWTIDGYRIAVDTYRNAQNKEEKRAMQKLIDDIKSDFRTEISKNDPKIQKLQKLQYEYNQLIAPNIFKEDDAVYGNKDNKKKSKEREKKLEENINKLSQEIEEIKANKIFENAFEWRFEFPEVLNDDGEFIGFDVVIGNPPYVRRTDLEYTQKSFYENIYKSATKQYDLYLLFIEKGLILLKSRGLLTFINPMFFVNDSGVGLRKLILENYNLNKIINLSSHNVFEEASTYPCIIEIQNFYSENQRFIYVHDNKITIKNILLIHEHSIFGRKDFIKNENLNFDFSQSNLERNLAKKIELSGNALKNYFFCARGIPNNKIKISKNGKLLGVKSKTVKRYETLNEFVNLELIDRNNIEFSEEMILLPRTVLDLVSTYKPQTDNVVVLDRIYYLKRKHDFVNVKCVIGLINSRLLNFWFSFRFSSTKVRGGYFDLRGTQINSIPIATVSDNKIERIVDQIIDAKNNYPQADTSELENQIDQLVYQLYGLTAEEIKIVEGKSEL